jgi:hypothetical protein
MLGRAEKFTLARCHALASRKIPGRVNAKGASLCIFLTSHQKALDEKVFVLETTAQDYSYGEKLRRKYGGIYGHFSDRIVARGKGYEGV